MAGKVAPILPAASLGFWTRVAPVRPAYPEVYLDDIPGRMMLANFARLAVVSRNDQRLVGYLRWRDLLRVRSRTQAEESQRVAFYRTR